MDVSKNRGTPKWMVKIMENPIKMDDLGGGKKPYFWFNTHISLHPSPPLPQAVPAIARSAGDSSVLPSAVRDGGNLDITHASNKKLVLQMTS